MQTTSKSLSKASKPGMIGGRAGLIVIPDLRGAVLKSHSLERADFSWTKLQEANLSGASLDRALLDAANLEGADLSGAWLTRAIITRASLHNTEFVGAKLGDTVFAETTLDSCKGLDGCIHTGPSSIDIETLRRSGPLTTPVPARNRVLTDKLIDYLPSLFGQPIQFFSCFISYSVRDGNSRGTGFTPTSKIEVCGAGSLLRT